MHLDLRIPIGMLFIALGGLLVLFGVISMGSPIYQASLGINMNIWWGGLLAIFGLSMLGAALLKK